MTCSLADLEDLASTGDLAVSFDRAPRSQILPRVKSSQAAQRRKERKAKRKKASLDSKENTKDGEDQSLSSDMEEDADSSSNVASPSSIVPGTQKIWMKTFGCAHNVSDGEYMQGMLGSYGYKFVDKKEDADLIFLNSCTVKNPSEMAVVNIVNSSKKIKKPVVMAGCVPQGDRNMNALSDISIVGISQIDRVVEVVEETLRGNTVRLLSRRTQDKDGNSTVLPRLDLPKVRRNPLVEIVPLSTGCLGACTYCKTRHARGKLGSYKLDDLLSRISSVVNEREVTEIWLSSEDTGAYGIDLGIDIGILLKSVVDLLPADQTVMLRIGMTNPPYMLQHLDAIAETLNHPSVFSFLHVPVQSGSNRILSDDFMNREYTREDFETVARHLLQKVPNLLLATDVICGFPGETEEDHQATVSLVEEFKFPVLNISQFYPRPGTPAAKMKGLPSAVKKTRSREMTKLFHSYRPLDDMYPLGMTCTAWISNESNPAKATRRAQTVAHTKNYTKVIVPLMSDEHKGARIRIKVLETHKFHIVAEVLEIVGMRRARRVASEEVVGNGVEGSGVKIHHPVGRGRISLSLEEVKLKTKDVKHTKENMGIVQEQKEKESEKEKEMDALYTDGPMVEEKGADSACCGGSSKGGDSGSACCGGDNSGSSTSGAACCGGADGGDLKVDNNDDDGGSCGCGQPTFEELLEIEEKYKKEAANEDKVQQRIARESPKHHAISMMLLTHVFIPVIVALVLMKVGMMVVLQQQQ